LLATTEPDEVVVDRALRKVPNAELSLVKALSIAAAVADWESSIDCRPWIYICASWVAVVFGS
jgi:hypothetical protein